MERFPEIRFAADRIDEIGANHVRIAGDLGVRGVSRPVTLDVDVREPIRDPFGNLRAAAEATGRLNRKDWGLTWNQALDAGALLVREEVRFTVDVQAIAARDEVVGAH